MSDLSFNRAFAINQAAWLHSDPNIILVSAPIQMNETDFGTFYVRQTEDLKTLEVCLRTTPYDSTAVTVLFSEPMTGKPLQQAGLMVAKV